MRVLLSIATLGALLFATGCPPETPPIIPTTPVGPTTGGDTGETAVPTADTAPAGPLCPDCEWLTGEWLDCSVTCGPNDGEQSRTVECIDAKGEPVNDDQCDARTEPDAVRTCNATVDCAWIAGEFSTCSETCGDGTQTRTVHCEDPAGTLVDGAWCDAASQPASQQVCTQTVDCSWRTGGYGACSTTCGDGLESRAVDCVDEVGGVVASNLCPAPAPAADRACSATADCRWVESGFGSCSTDCGNGQQTQTVTCQDPSGTVLGGNFCTDPQPANVQACLDTTACVWDTGAWSSCSATCSGDSGNQTRLVTCEDPSGSVVDRSWCSGSEPTSSMSCSGTTPYTSWDVGPWGICNFDCTQTRTVECPSGCCTGSAPFSVRGCTGDLCFDECDPYIICP